MYTGEELKDIRLENVDITGGDDAAALAVKVVIQNGSSLAIKNSHSTGSIKGGDDTGGLIATVEGENAQSLSIEQCSSEAKIQGGADTLPADSNPSVGGLVGMISTEDGKLIDQISIENSRTTGNIKGGESGGLVGVLVAWDDVTANVSNSYALGDIEGHKQGGLLGAAATGAANSELTIDHCYAAGDVGSGQFSGSLVGGTIITGDDGSLTINNSFGKEKMVGDSFSVEGITAKGNPQINDPASSKDDVIKHLVGLKDAAGNTIWTNKNGTLDNPVLGTEPSSFNDSPTDTPDDDEESTTENTVNNGTAGDQTAGKDKLTGKANQPNLLQGLAGEDTLIGGNDNDTLYGNQNDDLLEGGKGSDIIFGGKDNDTLKGGEGQDFLQGNQGNDKLVGGLGEDIIYGGKDNDTLDGGKGMDVLYGNKGNDKLDGGEGNDFLQGNQGDDKLVGGLGVDVIYGGKDNDTLDGGKDMDILYGNKGNDKLDGGEGNDFLQGNRGNDILFGGEGDDVLRGGKDDDILQGGIGNDILFGDKGNDMYLFAEDITENSGGIDLIANFTSGEDHIGLMATAFGFEVDATETTRSLSEELFTTNTTGNALDENDRIIYNSTTGALLFDADGSGAGEAKQFATLAGKQEITAADFLVVS